MLLQLAKKYKNVVVLSCGFNSHNYCQNFAKFFPERYFSFGFTESNTASVAAGFALRGKLPIIIADNEFIERAWSQIKNDICEPYLNVKILCCDGMGEGLNSELLKFLPNLKVQQVAQWDESLMDEYGPACYSICDG
ncbi:MAG: hypothetical protein AAB373_01040 [Patescibacteria group bacterium]